MSSQGTFDDFEAEYPQEVVSRIQQRAGDALDGQGVTLDV